MSAKTHCHRRQQLASIRRRCTSSPSPAPLLIAGAFFLTAFVLPKPGESFTHTNVLSLPSLTQHQAALFKHTQDHTSPPIIGRCSLSPTSIQRGLPALHPLRLSCSSQSISRPTQLGVELRGHDAGKEGEDRSKTRQHFDRAVAAVATMWWKVHSGKHSQLPPNALEIDYQGGMLGSGAFGWVYRAKIVEGEFAGMKVIAKRAKDGGHDEEDPNLKDEERPRSTDLMSEFELEEHVKRLDCESQAFHYLQVEALINDIVMNKCPQTAAKYLGICRSKGLRWLVWEDAGGDSLHELLEQSELHGTLAPLASALRLPFHPTSPHSLQLLVNNVAEQLLVLCRDLEEAGVAHRDLKPENILVCDGRLVLIDFGAAAAMGLPEMTGYDRRLAPCDPAYAPPEEFIDEELWGVYDVFSVGLCLVRILFQPLWGGVHWQSFSDGFIGSHFDLDLWLHRVIAKDQAIKAEGLLPKWLIPLHWVMIGAKHKNLADQEYVDLSHQETSDLADDNCPLEDVDGGRMHLCALQDGLEVLNDQGGGLCWATLRQMLAKRPADRLSSSETLVRLQSASPSLRPPPQLEEEEEEAEAAC